MKKKSLWLAWGFVLFTLGICDGYVLPAKQIVGMMTDHLGSGKSLVVAQKTVVYDSELEGGMREFEETLYFGYPDRFRSEAENAGVERIRVVNGSKALVVLDGKIVGSGEGDFDHFKDALLLRKPELLAQRLSQLGIDLRVVSLGRFKGAVSYVIGARYPDEGVPQLWVDKDSFMPVRMLLHGDVRGDGPLKAIEYTEWHREKGLAYPGRILFMESGALIRMHVATAYLKDKALSEEMFDIEALRRDYGTDVPAAGGEPIPPSELDDVKRRIENFGKSFE